VADSKTMTVFVRADIKNLSTNMAKVDRTLKSVLGNNGMKLSKTFATGMLVATAAMGAFGLASVKMAADFQTTQKAFDVLLGDTDKAKKHLADLAQFAAQTPFELKGLTEASKKMLAFQFDVQDVIPILTAVGDAAAMLGSGQEGIDGMLLALEQIKAKGRAQGQEMLQLAERGVNAYQYLADYLETDIPGVMDLLQKGAVDSTTAINAVVMGMQKDFKGGMDSLSKELNGMLSNLQDSVDSVMRDIGKGIIEGLNIKETVKEVTDVVTGFAAAVKKLGIREAFLEMVPPELIVAIGALGGAIMAVAVPALVAMAASALSAILAVASISAPVVLAAAVIGGAFAVVMAAADELGALWFNTWEYMKSTTATIANAISLTMWQFARTALKYLEPIMSFFGLDSTIKNWSSAVSENIKIASDELNQSALKQSFDSMGMDAAWNRTKNRLSGSLDKIKSYNVSDSLDTAFKGLKIKGTGGDNTSDGASGGALGKIANNAEKIAKNTDNGKVAVERMRDLEGKIAFYAADGTNCMRTIGMALEGTPFEGIINVDMAYAIGKEKGLNRDTGYEPKAGDIILVGGYDSGDNWNPRMHTAMVTETGGVIQNGKSHNGVYESELTPQQMFGDDITGYIATGSLFTKTVESVKDLKAKTLEWMETLNKIRDKASDLGFDLMKRNALLGLSGVRKEYQEIRLEADSFVTEMERKYRDMSLEFEKSSTLEKEAMKKAWEEVGIAFEENQKGEVTFAQQVAAERVLIEKETQQKIKDLRMESQMFEDDMEETHKNVDVEAMNELLQTETATNELRKENARAFMDDYYDLWKQAHTSFHEAFRGSLKDMTDSFQDFFSDVLTGASSIKESFADLLKSFISMIAEMVARWAAAKVVTGLFGGFSGKNNGSFSFSGGGSLISAGEEVLMSSLNIGSFASGGVASGLSLVGENGPELVRFNNPSRVFSNSESRNLLSGNNTSVNMYVSTPNAESFKQSRSQISASIASALQREGR